jgi:hypothetical protein
MKTDPVAHSETQTSPHSINQKRSLRFLKSLKKLNCVSRAVAFQGSDDKAPDDDNNEIQTRGIRGLKSHQDVVAYVRPTRSALFSSSCKRVAHRRRTKAGAEYCLTCYTEEEIEYVFFLQPNMSVEEDGNIPGTSIDDINTASKSIDLYASISSVFSSSSGGNSSWEASSRSSQGARGSESIKRLTSSKSSSSRSGHSSDGRQSSALSQGSFPASDAGRSVSESELPELAAASANEVDRISQNLAGNAAEHPENTVPLIVTTNATPGAKWPNLDDDDTAFAPGPELESGPGCRVVGNRQLGNPISIRRAPSDGDDHPFVQLSSPAILHRDQPVHLLKAGKVDLLCQHQQWRSGTPTSMITATTSSSTPVPLTPTYSRDSGEIDKSYGVPTSCNSSLTGSYNRNSGDFSNTSQLWIQSLVHPDQASEVGIGSQMPLSTVPSVGAFSIGQSFQNRRFPCGPGEASAAPRRAEQIRGPIPTSFRSAFSNGTMQRKSAKSINNTVGSELQACRQSFPAVDTRRNSQVPGTPAAYGASESWIKPSTPNRSKDWPKATEAASVQNLICLFEKRVASGGRVSGSVAKSIQLFEATAMRSDDTYCASENSSSAMRPQSTTSASSEAADSFHDGISGSNETRYGVYRRISCEELARRQESPDVGSHGQQSILCQEGYSSEGAQNDFSTFAMSSPKTTTPENDTDKALCLPNHFV